LANNVKWEAAQVRIRSQINLGKATIHLQRSLHMKTGTSSLNVDLRWRSVHVHIRTHIHTHTLTHAHTRTKSVL